MKLMTADNRDTTDGRASYWQNVHVLLMLCVTTISCSTMMILLHSEIRHKIQIILSVDFFEESIFLF
jgi:hypothetical protein